MSQHKYYWLRLQKDFFKRHDIRIIESMPNGKDYILFYLKLLVESVSHEGALRFSDTIPYSMEMLATVTDTNVDVVRSAVDIFKELNMLEVMDDATIFMSEVNNMIGSANEDEHQKESHRLRQQRYRERQKIKALESKSSQLRHSDVTRDGELEIEIELDKEIEIDIENLTLDIVKSYIKENNYIVDPERWFNYYNSNGWKVGVNPMENWKACIDNWNSTEKSKKKKSGCNSRDYNYDELEKELTANVQQGS